MQEERKITTLKEVKKFLSLLPTKDSGRNPTVVEVKVNYLNQIGPPSNTGIGQVHLELLEKKLLQKEFSVATEDHGQF